MDNLQTIMGEQTGCCHPTVSGGRAPRAALGEAEPPPSQEAPAISAGLQESSSQKTEASQIRRKAAAKPYVALLVAKLKVSTVQEVSVFKFLQLPALAIHAALEMR